MLKLVIFDFDGVLADSERAHYETIRNALVEKGLSLDWAAYCEKYLGYDDVDCFTAVLKDQGHTPTDSVIEELCQHKADLFTRHLNDHGVLFEGVEDLLQELHQAGIPRSIYTGSTRSETDFILNQENLAHYFTTIVTADDVTLGKPDPQGYILSLQQSNQTLNSQPPITCDQCVVIEDSMWGITAAKEAGMHCLALETSYPKKMLTQADDTVPALTQVNIPLLKKMAG